MTAPKDRRRLEAEVAARVAATPGVAYLSPNLLQRLTRPGEPSGGVRIRDGGAPRVEVWIAVRSGHQAAATARAVRARVTETLATTSGLSGAQVRITVTAAA